MKKCLALFFLLFLCLYSRNAEASADQFDDLKILFIGNSLTVYNDMPEMFKQLANANGRSVRVGKAFHTGKGLNEILYIYDARDSIKAEQWDYVVLQSSDLYAFEEFYDIEKRTILRFRELILENCPTTKIVYPMMWAIRDGFTYPINGIPTTYTYEEHYDLIYETIFPFMYDNEPLIVPPVGAAWNELVVEDDNSKFDLWAKDKVHPAWNGSYVMACVMHSAIYYECNNNIDFFAGIRSDSAYHYQEIARAAVRQDHSLWNINYDYTSIDEITTSQNFELLQNYPNPVADHTYITFKLAKPGQAKVMIFDLHGRIIDVLADQYFEIGTHQIEFKRNGLNPGIYFYGLEFEHKKEVRKLMLQ